MLNEKLCMIQKLQRLFRHDAFSYAIALYGIISQQVLKRAAIVDPILYGGYSNTVCNNLILKCYVHLHITWTVKINT